MLVISLNRTMHFIYSLYIINRFIYSLYIINRDEICSNPLGSVKAAVRTKRFDHETIDI